MQAEQEDFDTHFVENPFIKMREKAQFKTLHGKTILGKNDLDVNEEDHDIVMIKESGKFFIKDLEEEEN